MKRNIKNLGTCVEMEGVVLLCKPNINPNEIDRAIYIAELVVNEPELLKKLGKLHGVTLGKFEETNSNLNLKDAFLRFFELKKKIEFIVEVNLSEIKNISTEEEPICINKNYMNQIREIAASHDVIIIQNLEQDEDSNGNVIDRFDAKKDNLSVSIEVYADNNEIDIYFSDTQDEIYRGELKVLQTEKEIEPAHFNLVKNHLAWYDIKVVSVEEDEDDEGGLVFNLKCKLEDKDITAIYYVDSNLLDVYYTNTEEEIYNGLLKNSIPAENEDKTEEDNDDQLIILELSSSDFPSIAGHYDENDEGICRGVLTHFICMLENDLEDLEGSDKEQIEEEIQLLKDYMETLGDIYAILDIVEEYDSDTYSRLNHFEASAIVEEK